MKVICISSTVMLSAPPPCSAACTSAEAAGQPAAAQQEHIPALQGDAGGAAGLVDARRLIAAARGVLPGDLLRQALVQEMRPAVARIGQAGRRAADAQERGGGAGVHRGLTHRLAGCAGAAGAGTVYTVMLRRPDTPITRASGSAYRTLRGSGVTGGMGAGAEVPVGTVVGAGLLTGKESEN